MRTESETSDPHYARGIALLESGALAQAEACLSEVGEDSAAFPLAQYHCGIAALRASRLDAAERHFRRAAAHNPNFGAAWSNLGDVQMRLGNIKEAEESLRRATVETPLLAEAFYNLGTLMLNTQRLVEAEACLHRAIVLRPDFALAYNNLCEVMLRTQRADQALSCVHQAIALAPDLAPAHYNLSNMMLMAGRHDEAERSLRRALEIDPEFAQANHNLGRLLLEQHIVAEAEACLRAVVRARPQSAEAHRTLGTALMAAQHAKEALACFHKAIEIDPRDAEAHYNAGGALMTLNQAADALEALERGCALAPELAAGRLMLGMALLKLGRYREGWPHYEYFTARRAPGQDRSALAQALTEWQGDLLEGRSLIVLCDCGFSDVIQFVRFMPALKARGLRRLTLVCPPELKTLLASVREIDAVKSTDDHIDLRQADSWCYLRSVPLRLAVELDSLEATLPYLSVASAQIKRWKRRLERSLPVERLKVGLVSSGSPPTEYLHATLMDERRSLPHVAAYAPLLDVAGIAFISLHKDPRKRVEMRELPEALRPFDPMAEVEDFSDTAALIRNLDLVVTTDSAVAHLAGALNTPCWLLLNSDSDWRWLHTRADSPWYPHALRLFRQREAGNGDAVISEVEAALRDWAGQTRAQ
jgi:tetratricopeptide (TPR) repeat protein